jgi:hypothetical protein
MLLLFHPLVAGPWVGKAQVVFTGTSTLHDFEGKVSAPVTGAHSEGQDWTLQSSVAIANMSTDNPSRDKNMWAMFHADRYPELTVSTSISKMPAPGKSVEVELELNIADHQGKVMGTLTSTTDLRGGENFRLDFPVSLEAFGLERPTAMLGMVKVGDVIRVSAVIHLENAPIETGTTKNAPIEKGSTDD